MTLAPASSLRYEVHNELFDVDFKQSDTTLIWLRVITKAIHKLFQVIAEWPSALGLGFTTNFSCLLVVVLVLWCLVRLVLVHFLVVDNVHLY